MGKFHLPLTAAISAAILAASGCNRERDWQASSDTRVCVDDSGKRVPDERCRPVSPGPMPYRWYYIARGGYIPWFGHPAGAPAAGSYRSAPGAVPAGAVTRGGFGGIGEGHVGMGE